MADPFSINCNWSDIRSDEAEIGYSMANLQIRLNNENLTENENTWSKTIEDSVLTSAYPLAYWICSSWWRLLYEPLPPSGMIPSTDWRLSHELASANSGFVWPKIIFASDNRVVQIWSA
ncbi:MAG: hypothetical protein IPJ30_22400 [Acidobacteria bacterium]|nr:hypothetical protein [Acidobacteriota bacterium]